MFDGIRPAMVRHRKLYQRVIEQVDFLNEPAMIVPPDNPVVLVPGYRDNSTVFRRLIHYLMSLGFDIHPLSLVPSDGRVPLEQLAAQVKTYIDEAFAPEQHLDFVAFSMGGIVVRYYLQRLEGLARARRFVSLGAPHRGTWMAYSNDRPAVRQMRPGSGFLADLAKDESRLAQIQFTSIWTPLDLTIVPPSSSAVPVAHHRRLILPYHRALVTSNRSLRQIVQALVAPVE